MTITFREKQPKYGVRETCLEVAHMKKTQRYTCPGIYPPTQKFNCQELSLSGSHYEVSWVGRVCGAGGLGQVQQGHADKPLHPTPHLAGCISSSILSLDLRMQVCFSELAGVTWI